jgi:ornithine carbamoyltransferase
MNLISISSLSEHDIRAIWSLVDKPQAALVSNVAWSFEGNGIRTRTTFIRAFRELGMQFTELPNLLKTQERVVDLAGYLDPFFDLYVIRDTDHQRLEAFANASERPVINAMTASGHPCEVLTDAFYLERKFGNLKEARVCLWGPTTNVFRSWHELAAVLGFTITQVCEERFHERHASVEFLCEAPARADVVITDAWPGGTDHSALALSSEQLSSMGCPALLPTPPFTVGRELLLDPVAYDGFVGYEQKQLLLPVQKAILRWALAPTTAEPGEAERHHAVPHAMAARQPGRDRWLPFG